MVFFFIYLPVQFHISWPIVSVTKFVFLSKVLANAGRFKGKKIWGHRIAPPQVVPDCWSCEEWLGSHPQGQQLVGHPPQGVRGGPGSPQLGSGVGGVGGYVSVGPEREFLGPRIGPCVGSPSVATGHVYTLPSDRLCLSLVSVFRLGKCGPWKMGILETSPGLLLFLFLSTWNSDNIKLTILK